MKELDIALAKFFYLIVFLFQANFPKADFKIRFRIRSRASESIHPDGTFKLLEKAFFSFIGLWLSIWTILKCSSLFFGRFHDISRHFTTTLFEMLSSPRRGVIWVQCFCILRRQTVKKNLPETASGILTVKNTMNLVKATINSVFLNWEVLLPVGAYFTK